MTTGAIAVATWLVAVSVQAGEKIGPDPRTDAGPTARREHDGVYVHAGPKAGGSVNYDQWVAGGFLRAGGLCPFVCIGDLGVSLHEIAGLGGNYGSLRTSLRLDAIVWFGERESFGIYPAIGISARTVFPVGHFAEFCERTELPAGCHGTSFGAEVGLGLRFWPVFVEAIGATGELPSVTLTAGLSWTLWEHA